MILAQRAGIKLFATGGIGGVHRDVTQSMDISADLFELAHIGCRCLFWPESHPRPAAHKRISGDHGCDHHWLWLRRNAGVLGAGQADYS